MKKNSNNNIIKTTTLSAQVAISKTESGMDYVQVLPDNPRVGIVKPFSGWGKAQLLSNLSYGRDGFDRYVFVLPSDQRDEFAKLLARDVAKLMKILKEKKNTVR